MVFLADNIGVREAQHGGAVALGAVHRQLRADHADLGARRGDRAHRAHLHRVDQLQRAVPRRAQVRLARPHQRRPRRLEPGHLRPGRRGATTSAATSTTSHAERYERANEFAAGRRRRCGTAGTTTPSCATRRAGSSSIPTKMHFLNHVGEHFKVRGPLNIPRPPQGHPVIVQAGTSDDGMDVAARFAEVIFSANLTIDTCQKYFKEVKTRAQDKFGRNPDHLKVMPGLSPLRRPHRGGGEGEVRLPELADAPDRGARDPLDRARRRRPHALRLRRPDAGESADVATAARARSTTSPDSPSATISPCARSRRWWPARAPSSSWSARRSSLADQMEQWYVEEAADGFNIMPPYLPGALNDFVELVIPELQRRGLFRTEYTGRTLREHLGLPRPASRYASARRRGGVAPPSFRGARRRTRNPGTCSSLWIPGSRFARPGMTRRYCSDRSLCRAISRRI